MPEPKYHDLVWSGAISSVSPSTRRLRLGRAGGLALIAVPENKGPSDIVFWSSRGVQTNRVEALKRFAEGKPFQATVVVQTAGDELRIQHGHAMQRGSHTLSTEQWRAIAEHLGAKRIVSGAHLVYEKRG